VQSVIDPKTVMVGIPCHDGRLMTETCGMLITCRDLYGGMTLPTECSHPSLVRNIMADTFLRSSFEWFVGIDSDIVPARQDFLYLLEETDPSIDYFVEGDGDGDCAPGAPPRPSRVEASIVLTDLGDIARQKKVESRALADVLVCAEYAYKEDEFKPVQFGGGFYRVHRSVFSVLQQLTHADDGRVEVHRKQLERVINDMKSYLIGPDEIRRPMTQKDIVELNDQIDKLTASFSAQAGTPRLWQVNHRGRMFYDYFPSGPLVSQLVPQGEWKGEDHGFWTLCMLAGLVPRIETRTRLLHIGRKAYPYLGPDPLRGGGF
jgi:hypothetical protein